MYKFRYFCWLSVLAVFPVQAQEIDMQQKIQEAFNIPQIQELLSSGFQVSDVNNDGFISENEFSYLVDSIEMETALSDEQKNAKRQRWQKYFEQVDANGDKMLDEAEYTNFLQKESEFMAQERMQKINEMANKSPEEIMEEFNAQMAKAKEALDKLQNMPPEELADKFIDSISNNIAGENYFQMDKDKDGCVTEDEYVDYMIVFSKNVAENAAETENKNTAEMSEEEWRSVYRNEEEKAKENCLTKEEYVRNFNQMADVVITDDTLEEQGIDNLEVSGEE
ncbi:MAG: hypothetical protein MR350_05170 [Alphaproteobacteria bacterium]|nr:hypothetical protein [Alphaproteobacteria bacterium]